MALDRELFTKVIQTMVEDNVSLRRACLKHNAVRSTILNWVMRSEQGDEGFEGLLDQYTRARDLMLRQKEDDFDDLADPHNPEYAHLDPATRRICSDSKKWSLTKLWPKKYGDKMETTLKGDKENPIVTVNTSNLSTEQLKAIEAIMSGKGSDDTNT